MAKAIGQPRLIVGYVAPGRDQGIVELQRLLELSSCFIVPPDETQDRTEFEMTSREQGSSSLVPG